MLKPLAALALVLLTGCQAPVAPVASASVPAKSSRALAAPLIVPTARLRHVLDTSAGATLFGINYRASVYSYTYSHSSGENWTVNIPFSGRGTLTKASRDRAVYQVPSDQVLIINQVLGRGNMAINGYSFGTPQASVSYVFGPGELVVFTFAPVPTNTTGSSNTHTTTFETQSISGYTTDPALLGQLGHSLAK